MTDLQQHLQAIRDLDDDGLLRSLKRHVGSANRINALVLAHLAEVDARGAYRNWACETLAAYCVYELRLSEDEAQRRCRAARVMRQFPVLFEMIADASIHLTGLLLLAPYLTADNHEGVLVRARYRSKREIERLVAELAPSRDVPALVEPLGVSTGSRTIPGKGWAALTESTLGWVRHLESGDGPARAPSAPEGSDEELSGDDTVDDVGTAPAPARGETSARSEWNEAVGPARAPLHYRVQFTADQAYVDLLDQARALLWHQLPSGDLVELQRLALQALVDKLAKRKFGAKASAAPAQSSASLASSSAAPARIVEPSASPSAAPARIVEPPASPAVAPAETGEPAADTPPPVVHGPAQASRHIPAAVRREVWERDGGRCAFVDHRGQRCRATSALEFHHMVPHARGGPATPENLRLRCRTHNALAAEQDFGREFVLSRARFGSSDTIEPC